MMTCEEKVAVITGCTNGIGQATPESFLDNKKVLYSRTEISMAESMRFELMVAFTTPPFQDGALSRSASSPRLLNHYIR